MNVLNLNSTYVVLGSNGDAVPITVSDRFFADLEQQFGDFKGRWLISYFTFDKNWDVWEAHPAGDEWVYLLSGHVDFILDLDGVEQVLSLDVPGTYVLVPRGTWHTARIHVPSSMLFVTPGEGTQHRPIDQSS